MEPNLANTGSTGADAGEGSVNPQPTHINLFYHTGIQSPYSNIRLPFRPAYHGKGVCQIDTRLDRLASSDNSAYSSAFVMPVSQLDASPSMFKPKLASPASVSDRITNEEYERVLEQNKRLEGELRLAKEAERKANQACRDLAAWVLWERNRLIAELEEVRMIHRAFIQDEVDQLIAEEMDRLPAQQ